jgi:membrane associated rhomboid family serine protease
MKPVHSAEAGADLDVCPACHIVWFDPSEYQRVPKLNIREAPSQMTQALANAPSKPRPRVVAGDSALPPDSIDGTWKYIPGLFGLPVEYDWEPVNRKPVAVWAVTAIAALCLIPAYFAPRELFLSYGFTPADWARHDGLTIITSFFLHDGIFHLLINFYFLMVFGDNVEDC